MLIGVGSTVMVPVTVTLPVALSSNPLGTISVPAIVIVVNSMLLTPANVPVLQSTVLPTGTFNAPALPLPNTELEAPVAGVVHVRLPFPSLVNTWPLAPWLDGKLVTILLIRIRLPLLSTLNWELGPTDS